jgi:hypothetical protein
MATATLNWNLDYSSAYNNEMPKSKANTYFRVSNEAVRPRRCVLESLRSPAREEDIMGGGGSRLDIRDNNPGNQVSWLRNAEMSPARQPTTSCRGGLWGRIRAE